MIYAVCCQFLAKFSGSVDSQFRTGSMGGFSFSLVFLSIDCCACVSRHDIVRLSAFQFQRGDRWIQIPGDCYMHDAFFCISGRVVAVRRECAYRKLFCFTVAFHAYPGAAFLVTAYDQAAALIF